jgi:predicted nucleic acid-binding protein
MGRGIGYVDASLLAAAMLSGAQLWTGDKRPAAIAEDIGYAHQPKAERAGGKQ